MTPQPGSESNERRDATSAMNSEWGLARRWWLPALAFALVAFSLMYATLRLSGDMATAKDPCSSVTPSGHALQIIANIHTSLLASGAASVLSWICAVFASRSASGSEPGPRRALLALSIVVLVGLVISFGWYALSSTCMEFA